ncbi:hypothetical protein ACIBI9_11270 [Nonomuraea sp. NPDC050451]|uniref:hypothetical protein n=1 Tax=Nonomuraea sp. NPDC050451 TaxID=3364364 RepID=UPI0037AAF460
MGRNPVTAVAALVHRLDPAAFDQAVVTVGTLRVSECANVVPTLAEVGVTVRAATEDAVTRAVARVARSAEEAGRGWRRRRGAVGGGGGARMQVERAAPAGAGPSRGRAGRAGESVASWCPGSRPA